MLAAFHIAKQIQSQLWDRDTLLPEDRMVTLREEEPKEYRSVCHEKALCGRRRAVDTKIFTALTF